MAEVSRVFDGETIRALLHTGAVETIRYIGIDAPDPTPSDCFGPEATLYNRDLVINRTVWLELDERERDADGRLLAYVYLDSKGLAMVNAILIAQGFARAVESDQTAPNIRYVDLFSELEGEARSAGRGLWGACTTTSPPADNQPPRAEFTFSPENPRPGETVQFDASASVDPDGQIVKYDWDFGDGVTASGLTVAHEYAKDGSFTVTLTVTDDRGAIGLARKTIAVGEATAPQPPPSPPSSEPLTIELIHYDAEGDDNANKNGEWIVLRANRQVSLGGWTLADELGDRGVSSHVYRFPEGFLLSLGERVTIFTGCGTDTKTELYWCARTQIWDNGEDTAILKDDQGQLVDRCHYGDPDGSERGKSEFNCETREFR
jgi:endonuclease YncB( thermonuclease family)